MSDKKKPQALSLFDKQKILKLVEEQEKIGAKPNLTDLGRKFNVHRTTISKIIKKKDDYKQRIQDETQSPTSKRKRHFKFENIDAGLNIWINQKGQQNARLNNAQIQFKASKLAEEAGVEFSPSVSWINRCKKRHGYVYKREHGEGQHNDSDGEAHFREHILPNILKDYEPEDIYNTDETALYPRGLPDRGYAKKDEQLKGSKKAKDKITVLLTTNMTGSDKRELLVIGKSKKPRCFPRDLSALPVTSPTHRMPG